MPHWQYSQGRVMVRRNARPYVFRPANRATIKLWVVFVQIRGQGRVFQAGS